MAAAVASAAKPTTSVPVALAVAVEVAAPAVALDATGFNYTGLGLTEALEVIMLMAVKQEKVAIVIWTMLIMQKSITT